MQWENGRWDDANCDSSYFFACEDKHNGSWSLSSYQGKWTSGAAACASLSGNYEFSVPTNSKDNQNLKAVKGGNGKVWLNYNDSQVEGNWQPPKGKALFRELRDGRSNLCLDVKVVTQLTALTFVYGIVMAVMLKNGIYDAANGYMRSATGKCLDNRGQTHNDGGISIYDCVDSNNLRFDWVGNSIRNRHNREIAVDAYGDNSGAQVGQWSYHGGSNQQWLGAIKSSSSICNE